MKELTEPQKLWVQALRSGEFMQTENHLSNDGAYCCLGVACVLAEREGVDVKKCFGEIEGEELDVQKDVLRWIGLKDDCGRLQWVATSLTELNDDNKLDFNAIARVIEEFADELFV